MITKEKAWKSGDKCYATLAEAQKAELEALFVEIGNDVESGMITNSCTMDDIDIPRLCEAIVKRIDRFKDILATTENSRPRARKINKPKHKSIKERAADILNQAVADGIRRQNAKNNKEEFDRSHDSRFEVMEKSLPGA